MKMFDWTDYLEVADHLLREVGEGYIRAACSRAYDGVFCPVRDKLETRRGTAFPPERNVHRLVVQELRQDPRRHIAHLGENLDRLRRERNWADYNGSFFSTERARKSVLLAREIQGGISEI